MPPGCYNGDRMRAHMRHMKLRLAQAENKVMSLEKELNILRTKLAQREENLIGRSQKALMDLITTVRHTLDCCEGMTN